jgi:hypothetical protein
MMGRKFWHSIVAVGVFTFVFSQAMSCGNATRTLATGGDVEAGARYIAVRHLSGLQTIGKATPGQVELLRDMLGAIGLVPGDIGSSDDELRKLVAHWCYDEAQEQLAWLRSGTHLYEEKLGHLDYYLREGGLDPKDVGTSREELANLAEKGERIRQVYAEGRETGFLP